MGGDDILWDFFFLGGVMVLNGLYVCEGVWKFGLEVMELMVGMKELIKIIYC